MTGSVQLLALALALPRVAHAGCSTDEDCSLLGECQAGACVCDAGWSGPDCAALALKLSRPIALPGGAPGDSGSSYVAPDGYSSWGMSVVRDVHGDGQYHGFVSQFKYGCDLDTWGTNSYVNHVVSDRPSGPWKQAGIALETWAHNPKVIWSAQDKTWVMYHIGTGNDPGKAVNCTKSADPSDVAVSRSNHDNVDVAESSSRPFQISYAKSLNGPWTSLSEADSAPVVNRGNLDSTASSSLSTLFTAYPGVDNIGEGQQKPDGGVHLYEDPKHGNGVAFVSFANFTSNPARKGALAWDACGGPPLTFDNGHPIEIVGVGSAIRSLRVSSGKDPESHSVGVLAASGCAVMYPGAASSLQPVGPFTPTGGQVSLPGGINYLEISATGANATNVRVLLNDLNVAAAGLGLTHLLHMCLLQVRLVGTTEDPEGCRGACEVDDACTSYTWRETAKAGKQLPSGDWADVQRGTFGPVVC